MKLGSVTKLDKRNTTMSNKFDGDVMSAYYGIFVIFPIYGWSGAIGKLNFEYMVCNSYILVNSNLLSCKNWKQNKKNFNTALILRLWVKELFLPKNVDFLQICADISKIKRVLILKGIFSKSTYVCVCLRAKFQASSVILTSFRQLGFWNWPFC